MEVDGWGWLAVMAGSRYRLKENMPSGVYLVDMNQSLNSELHETVPSIMYRRLCCGCGEHQVFYG